MFEEERRIGFVLGYIIVIELVRSIRRMRLIRSFCKTYFVLNWDLNRVSNTFEIYSFEKEWAFDEHIDGNQVNDRLNNV